VYEALKTLAAWHLVVPVDGRWRLVPGTSQQLLAEQFGCLSQVRTQVGPFTALNGRGNGGRREVRACR
jgi:hypothetical protein